MRSGESNLQAAVRVNTSPVTWDVVIAGAGPAGTVAATILARAGARVLIVDRARFPRDKLCGDSVNPGALSILRRWNLASGTERHGVPIDGMLVCGADGVRIGATYPKPLHGRTVMRRDLDHWLLEEAIRAGAQFEEGVTVLRALMRSQQKSVDRECVAGVVIRSRTGREVPLRARVTMAADGRRSTLAFGLRLSTQPDRPRRWAVGAYFDGVAGNSSMGEMHIRPGLYVGLAPLPGGLTNICAVGTPATLTYLDDPERALRNAIDREAALRDRLADARLVTRPVVLGPLAVDTRSAGVAGLLLTGDAAGFIDPMTGDGLRFAVKGAELAAEAALEALALGDPQMHLTLARRRHSAFASKWRFNRTLRRLVDSPAALRIATLAATLAPSGIRALVAMAGDCATLDRSSPNGNDRCDVDCRASESPYAR